MCLPTAAVGPVCVWPGTGVEPPSVAEKAEELLRSRSEEQSLALPPMELTDADR